jgi:metal-dependent amidase/aminoacylase/carboxypeptidase family protein
MSEAAAAVDRLKEIARGACLMTRTTVELRDESGSDEMLPNMSMEHALDRTVSDIHMRRVMGSTDMGKVGAASRAAPAAPLGSRGLLW